MVMQGRKTCFVCLQPLLPACQTIHVLLARRVRRLFYHQYLSGISAVFVLYLCQYLQPLYICQLAKLSMLCWQGGSVEFFSTNICLVFEQYFLDICANICNHQSSCQLAKLSTLCWQGGSVDFFSTNICLVFEQYFLDICANICNH